MTRHQFFPACPPFVNTVYFSKMLRNKSFDFRAKFGAIYSASETKECVLKNIPIDNRIWLKNRQTLELLVPRIRNYCNIAVCIFKEKG